MLRLPPALRVAPFGTLRSVNRNFSIRILYSDGDDFPGHGDELVPGEVAVAQNVFK